MNVSLPSNPGGWVVSEGAVSINGHIPVVGAEECSRRHRNGPADSVEVLVIDENTGGGIFCDSNVARGGVTVGPRQWRRPQRTCNERGIWVHRISEHHTRSVHTAHTNRDCVSQRVTGIGFIVQIVVHQ